MPKTLDFIREARFRFPDLAWRCYAIIRYARADGKTIHQSDWPPDFIPTGPDDVENCCLRHIEALKMILPQARELSIKLFDLVRPVAPFANFIATGSTTMHQAVLMTADAIVGDRRSWPERKALLSSYAIPNIGDIACQLWNELQSPDNGKETESPKPDCTHSIDFASVNWYGTVFDFTPNQAACVAILWKHWEQGRLAVAGTTLRDEAEINSEHLRHVFRDHPAWGTMIVTAGKGIYRLAKPESSEAKPTKRKSLRRSRKRTGK